jgi:hypothetical protein
MAVLTFFLCVLDLSLTLTNVLSEVGNGRTAHSWFILDGFAQELAPYNAGMIVCIALYACGFFFESRLGRRKLALDRAPNATN